VTLLAPELAAGALAALVRLLLLPALPVAELPVPELPVLELAVPELPDAPAARLPDIPVRPDEAAAESLDAVCCVPGSAKATAPVAITLTAAAVAVTTRSRAREWSRSATARLVSCECLLIGGSFLAGLLTQPSRQCWAVPLASL
jgi:hypothetical protein